MAGANKTFRVTLGDGVSGPANKGAAALRKLARAFQAVNKAARAATNSVRRAGGAAGSIPSVPSMPGVPAKPRREAPVKRPFGAPPKTPSAPGGLTPKQRADMQWRARANAKAARLNKQYARQADQAARKQQAARDKWNKSIAKSHAARDKEIRQQQKLSKGAGRLRWRLAANVAVGDLIARGVSSAARAAWELGKAFVGAVAHGVKVGENLRFSLTRFLGSADAAEKALADIMKISNELGISFEEAGGDFKNFVSAGFSQLEAKDLVRFKADIVALGDGSERSLQRVQEAFIQVEKAMATGRFEADGFNSILANIPVTKEQILAKLVKSTGKSLKELMKTDITKLPVKETLKAMQEAMLEATGEAKLGTAAWKKQASTLTGLWNAVKNRAKNAFVQVGMSLGPKLAEAVLPHLQKLAKWMASPEFAAGLERLSTGVAEFASESIPKIVAFAEGFGETFAPIIKAASAVGDLVDALDIGDGPSEGWYKVGEAIAVANTGVAMIGPAISAVASAISWVVDSFVSGLASIKQTISQITAAISGESGAASAAASSVGSAIVQGLVAGIIPGPIVAKLGSVVDQAVSSAKSKLGIGSPSKVFEEIGMWTGAGLTRGLDSQAPAVSAAAAGLIRPNIPAAPPANTTNMGGVSAPVTISVNAADDPEATAEAVRRMLVTELGDMFEQVNLQVGAA